MGIKEYSWDGWSYAMAPKQECGATGVFGDFWLDGGGETASSHWSISDSEVLVIMICPRMASH
jgi:hypothetical protein